MYSTTSRNEKETKEPRIILLLLLLLACWVVKCKKASQKKKKGKKKCQASGLLPSGGATGAVLSALFTQLNNNICHVE